MTNLYKFSHSFFSLNYTSSDCLRDFSVLFNILVDRKLDEFYGKYWDSVVQNAYLGNRSAYYIIYYIAQCRATNEIVNRFKKSHTNKFLTLTHLVILCYVYRNYAPLNISLSRLYKQSFIDMAGGIPYFSNQIGITPRMVFKWRDSGKNLISNTIKVIADLDGILWSSNELYLRSMFVDIIINDRNVVDIICLANFVHDFLLFAVILGPVVTSQINWLYSNYFYYKIVKINSICVQF